LKKLDGGMAVVRLSGAGWRAGEGIPSPILLAQSLPKV